MKIVFEDAFLFDGCEMSSVREFLKIYIPQSTSQRRQSCPENESIHDVSGQNIMYL